MLQFLQLTVFALSLSLSVGHFSSDGHLSCSAYDKAYLSIDDLLSSNADLIPGIVRLSFHDCVGHSCDGCLNFDQGPNAGLLAVAKELDDVYEKEGIDRIMSRADFWSLAGNVALVRGGLKRRCEHDEKCEFFYMQFWWGREDCPSSPSAHYEARFPSSLGDWNEVWSVLHSNFGLNTKEIVALLGAHSLGGASAHASGHKYNWQKYPLVFDNSYFRNLVHLKYEFEDVSHDPSKPRNQFVWHDRQRKSIPLMMLNTDMCLLKKVVADTEKGQYSGELSCPFKKGAYVSIAEGVKDFVGHCKDAHTAPLVEHFSKDLKDFYDVFSVAWWKMVSNGYKGKENHLKLPGIGHEKCGYCIPKGGHCVKGFQLAGACCPGSLCKNSRCH